MAIVGLIITLLGAVAMLVGWIMILIAAFKEKVTKGLLALFIPFYAIYYVFAKYQPDNKTLVIILYLGGWVVSIIGNVIASAGAVAMM
ncbi:MAG: hypothetical protein JW904_02305 [Spirochaetales bacterium]|nr:hypothetical protein [Spirochaetales bacterium]